MRKGLQNTLPATADSRAPLLLPLIMTTPEFTTAHTDEQKLLRFASILGFIGMMRPHSLEALSPASFTLVTQGGRTISMPAQPSCFAERLKEIRTTQRILGFYVEFRSKTKAQARAHFPSLTRGRLYSQFAWICPVTALIDITTRGLLKKHFLKPLNKKMRLTK